MERNNVLLKITDLRQYFPVGKKKGLYVKANDGISLNIYEGETVGLVGESGCGKSTFGRTLLQLYRQTDGKTMYYGASRDELAPEYIEKTIRHLPHGLHELAALEKKRDEMQKVYDAADEQKRLHMHNDLTAAKKAANDAYLNIVNVIGGFITAKDLGPVMKIFSERHDRCCDLHKAIEACNIIAPEHLEVCVEDPFGVLNEIKNAGSIFLGRNVPEALGDYFAGPNHTLPTSGTARFSSPLGVDDFVKKSSFLYYTREALGEVAPRIADFAEREGLHAHARSVTIRYE